MIVLLSFLDFERSASYGQTIWIKIGDCYTPGDKDITNFSDNRVICSPEDCPEGDGESLPPICGGKGSDFPSLPPGPCDIISLGSDNTSSEQANIETQSPVNLDISTTNIAEDGDASSDICRNRPPEADAGEDQNGLRPGQIVSLNGEGLDPDGDELKFEWHSDQISLEHPDSASPSFKVPALQNGKEQSFSFELTVTDEKFLSDSDNVDIKAGCTTQAKWHDNGIWKFKYQAIMEQGLVIKDVFAGDQRIFDSISIPHFKIESFPNNFGFRESKIVRYCDPNDSHAVWNSAEPKVISQPGGIDVLHWWFSVRYDENSHPGLIGELAVNYDIVIRTKPVRNCEGGQNVCYRFIPMVSYDWKNKDAFQQPLKKFTAFYKLDYGENTGLTRTLDSDVTVPFFFSDYGRQSMITNEVSFNAVLNGQPGKFDNIHTAHPGHPGQYVSIPGCRMTVFDCVHMHWRWSGIFMTKKVDVLVEPSSDKPVDEALRGKPYLVPLQTIDIAIVKFNDNEGEKDPDNPLTLANNKEQIATAKDKLPNCTNCFLTHGGHPIVWYVASVPEKNSNTFFRHGIFVLDSTKK